MASYNVHRGLSKSPDERVLYFTSENCHVILRQRRYRHLDHKIEFKGDFATADIAEFLMLIGVVLSFLIKDEPHWRRRAWELK